MPDGAEWHHPADRAALDAARVRRRVRRHRGPPIHRRQPLDLLRPRGPAARPARAGGRGLARAARRDRQRHRPRRRWCPRHRRLEDAHASVQFDAETLTPTYRLLKGVPGRSYGLAIARRLGIAADVLDLAERAVPDRERTLDALLATVEARSRELEARERALAVREE